MHLGSKLGLAALAFAMVNASVAGQTNSTLTHKVSGDFKSAPLKDVLAWLSKSGLSFVVKDQALDGKLTIHIANQPLKDAADAVAKALGGRWERSGNVFTLKSGGDSPFYSVQSYPGIDGKDFKFMTPDSKAWSEKDMKVWQDKMSKLNKDLPNMKVWTDGMKGLDEKEWKRLQEDMSKMKLDLPNMKAWTDKDMKAFQFDGSKMKGLDQKEWKRLQEDMSKMKFDMPNMESFKLDMSKMKGMDPKEMKALQDQLSKMKFDMPDMNFWADGMKGFQFDGSKMKQLDERQLKELYGKVWTEKDMKGLQEKLGKDSKPDSSVFVMKAAGIKELMSSLTKEQWEKHEKQGHLTPADLTESQLKMLGDDRKGDWTLSFSIDGKSLTIKSKG